MVDWVGDANSMLIYDFYRYVVVFLFCFFPKYVELCALKKTLFLLFFLNLQCTFFTLDPSLVENEELYLY